MLMLTFISNLIKPEFYKIVAGVLQVDWHHYYCTDKYENSHLHERKEYESLILYNNIVHT